MNNNNIFSLKGLSAIVTGGAQGLGKEMAFALADAGASVLIADKNEEGARVVAKNILDLGRKAVAKKIDVSQIEQVKEMVHEAVNVFGSLDILVNNAADFHGAEAEDISLEEWRKTIDDNLTSVFLCCQAAREQMAKKGKGVIINISSIGGVVVVRPQMASHYEVAKSGINMLTRALAVEWSKYNIRVNAIAPGYMSTSNNLEAIKINGQRWLDLIPQQRIAKPFEIRGPLVFLASDASSYITGHVLMVDGGYTIW
jgi:NAD(P)-dependent dehydrogenase (short-subunit alcohol dehydrogenase family)